jgi:ribosomal protein S27E
MSPAYEEYVFDLADLKFVGIVCGHCQGEVIIDASNSAATMPLDCSICAKAFEQPVAAPASLLLQALKKTSFALFISSGVTLSHSFSTLT